MVGATADRLSPDPGPPAPGSRYQWYADGVAISGATRVDARAAARRSRTSRSPSTVTGTQVAATARSRRPPRRRLEIALTACAGHLWHASGRSTTLSAARARGRPARAFRVSVVRERSRHLRCYSARRSPSSCSQYGKSISVRVTGSLSGYQTIARDSVEHGGRAAIRAQTPISGTWNCPSWAPIKGNPELDDLSHAWAAVLQQDESRGVLPHRERGASGWIPQSQGVAAHR